MNYVLFDEKELKNNLLPLTFTRPICDLRFGILTIREKWEKALGAKTSTLTSAYLSKLFPVDKKDNNILIRSNLIPNAKLVEAIKLLKSGETLVKGNNVLAYHLMKEQLDSDVESADGEIIEYSGDVECLQNIWELFSKAEEQIKADFQLLTKGRKSAKISNTNHIIGAENIFVEEGAEIEFATLNAKNGPIYIGKDAIVMEGALVRGPFVLGEHSQLKMGAKVYGATVIGPHCKVGGEVSNSVFLGYANKAHDGFIGNSVIGEWCNLGAGTNISNLKNTYDTVRLWNYGEEKFVNTGLQFCGLIMGDHSKTAINSQLNTGTVMGVSVNLFGSGFPRNFIPSFSWGGSSGFKEYNLNKAIEVADKVYKRRDKEFSDLDKELMRTIYKFVIR